MPVAALSAGNLPVGDVADKDVAERVLALIRDARSPLTPNELPALEVTQRRLELFKRGSVDGRDGSSPEHLADDSRSLQKSFVLRRKRVEAGGDDALDR